jgi:hypothetical protein
VSLIQPGTRYIAHDITQVKPKRHERLTPRHAVVSYGGELSQHCLETRRSVGAHVLFYVIDHGDARGVPSRYSAVTLVKELLSERRPRTELPIAWRTRRVAVGGRASSEYDYQHRIRSVAAL